ncbi:IS630 family transposase [Fischerella sp. JS2]|uniref:IS630 family transposase n=1 Tax=Fischerella sp. JS2 TaxID=2597771 RepID=UPI0028ED5386|nr:IS630 family transposase [Fischerella sp. JS2]
MPLLCNARYFVQDESRFGLKTIEGRKITLPGVKPIGDWQWQFKAFWLYGAVEPLTGESLFWQFSHVDTECYQQFLNEFAACYPKSLNILQVDNGLFHKAKRLQIPENIVLLFQPAHSPELNPIERVWEYLKQDLKWELFDHLEHLQTKVAQLLALLTPQIAASLTGYDFILNALSVANIF